MFDIVDRKMWWRYLEDAASAMENVIACAAVSVEDAALQTGKHVIDGPFSSKEEAIQAIGEAYGP
jgi:hypothetical protein